MLQHHSACCRSAEEYACKVDVDYLLPLLECHLFCRSVYCDTSIVVAGIQFSICINNFCNHGLNLVFLRNVALDRDCLGTCCFCNLLCNLLGTFKVDVYDSDIRACLCECSSRCLADSACSTCYINCFSIQSHTFNNSHFVLLPVASRFH